MTVKPLFAIAFVSLASAALAQSSGVTPGLWEIAVTIDSMDMPGMPAGIARMMTGRTTRVKHCITPADAARGPQDMLKSAKNCTFTRYSMAGGKLDSAMTCQRGGSTTTTTSSGSFTPTGFTAKGRSVTTMSNGTSTMTSTSVGRRTGDCGK